MLRLRNALLIALLMAGCATTPKQTTDYLELVRTRLNQGVSTKEDVKQLLGKPQNRTVTDYSNANMPKLPFVDTAAIMPYEMWTYSWIQTVTEKEPGKTFPLLGTIRRTAQVITISFDRDGKVTGFTTSENDI